MTALTYRSPKADVRPSPIHGTGLFARHAIARGDIVAVKGGHVLTTAQWANLEPALGPPRSKYESLVIAPVGPDRARLASMLYTNHSCDPNLAIQVGRSCWSRCATSPPTRSSPSTGRPPTTTATIEIDVAGAAASLSRHRDRQGLDEARAAGGFSRVVLLVPPAEDRPSPARIKPELSGDRPIRRADYHDAPRAHLERLGPLRAMAGAGSRADRDSRGSRSRRRRALQETWCDRGGQDQATRLAKALGYHGAYGGGTFLAEDWGTGSGLLSRWPFGAHGLRRVPRFGPGPIGAEPPSLDVSRGRAGSSAFSVALDWPPASQRRAAILGPAPRLVRARGRGPAFPTVICGDFNAPPDSDELRMLTGRAGTAAPGFALFDVEIAGNGGGHTWTRHNPWAAPALLPDRRIDYVLVGRPRRGGARHVAGCAIAGAEPVDASSRPTTTRSSPTCATRHAVILELAMLCTGLFAGAAVYVSLVEHPARLAGGPVLAIAEFRPSYRRGAVIQAAASGAASRRWPPGPRAAPLPVLIAGLLLGSLIPFTLIVILPTNKRLLDAGLAPGSPETAALLARWGHLHAVRSGVNGVAFLLLGLHRSGMLSIYGGGSGRACRHAGTLRHRHDLRAVRRVHRHCREPRARGRLVAGPERVDFSGALRQWYDRARVARRRSAAIRWLAAQPKGPAKILMVSEEWSSDCRRDVPMLGRLVEAAAWSCVSSRATARSRRGPKADPAESPNADLMNEFLREQDGRTYQSIPTWPSHAGSRVLYHYTELPRSSRGPPGRRDAGGPAGRKPRAGVGALPRDWGASSNRHSSRCGPRRDRRDALGAVRAAAPRRSPMTTP